MARDLFTPNERGVLLPLIEEHNETFSDFFTKFWQTQKEKKTLGNKQAWNKYIQCILQGQIQIRIREKVFKYSTCQIQLYLFQAWKQVSLAFNRELLNDYEDS